MRRNSKRQIEFRKFHSAQAEIAKNLTGRDFLRCGRRFGKALAVDTPIPTPDGWVAMGDLQVGDLVFDETGTICTVTFATEIMHDRPCNVVRFSDGSEIIADDDHLWLTWSRSERKNTARGYARGPSIRTTAEIASSISYSPRGDLNHSIPNCCALDTPSADLPVNPYVMGVWLGDGYSAGSRFCSSPDDMEEISQHLMNSGAVLGAVHQAKTVQVRSILGCGKRLRAAGVWRNKHVPVAYLRADTNQRLAILQGMMDTDGSVSAYGHCEFTSTNRSLADGVLELTRSLGIRSVMSEGRATISGRDCGAKYRVTFSTELPVFRLQRKAARLRSKKPARNISHRFIRSVTPTDSVPVRCIQVDSPSRLYLAGRSMIPTHNTTLIEDVAGYRAVMGKRVGVFMPAYKLITPTYARINATIAPARLRSSKQEMIIETVTGGCVEFWSLDNEDAGRSRFYDLVVLDEASLVAKGLRDTWEQAIAPTLLDRDGDVIVAGTPKGVDPDNFFHELWADAVNNPNRTGKSKYGFTDFHRPTWTNPTLNADAVARLKDDNAPLVYQQEFCAEFVDWSGAAFFSLESMLVNGSPVPTPDRCDIVFATIDTAVKTGKENDGTAVCFWAQSRVGTPLVLLDWSIDQIEGAVLETWLPSVFARLEELARVTNARRGTIGAFIEDKASGSILLQQARNRNWPAHDIDSILTAMGKEERAISVSGYVYQGKVKLSQEAHDKVTVYKNQSRNHLITQVCGFRIGVKDPRAQDDLLDAYTYGVAIALGDAYGI